MTTQNMSPANERDAGKARRAKVHKLADNLMRWLIVLVVALILSFLRTNF